MSKRTGDEAGTGGGDASPGDLMELTPLGAGQEVGRSCMHMTFKGKTIMFDCGIHPGYSGIMALPYFDEIDPSQIDLLLITHFHLDHCASLPYFLYKTTFKGRCFMTHSTKAIYKMMLEDFIKVSKVGSEDDQLFDLADLNASMDKIEVVDFHQEIEVNGIRFWAYTAGHVLGAAMFMVDIAGTRLLYTGDYSREEDRHLKAAEMPEMSPDVCVIESTYGVQSHQPRKERERRFTDLVASSVSQGGRVLIPVFALGRAQELLLILEEYWQTHRELHNVPIYYCSPLAKKCMGVYQTFINSMNDRIKALYEVSNPFKFKFIQNLQSIDHFNDHGPSVVMASPGMLQSGLSRQLFDTWCQDKRNACVIPGYCVEGTLAKHILSEPKEVTLLSGEVVPLHMKVHYISFSAHADYTQTSEFLSQLQPPNIVLVHGEATEMGRLKAALQHKFDSEGKEVQLLNPKNTQTVQMRFKSEKVARAVGSLGANPPKPGSAVSGLLVRKGFTHRLLAPEDLASYTHLQTGSVVQRQSLPMTHPLPVLRERLEQMYEGVEQGLTKDLASLTVAGRVTVLHQSAEHVIMEWESHPTSDMIADSVVAVVLQLGEHPGPGLSGAGAPGVVAVKQEEGDGEQEGAEGEKGKALPVVEPRMVSALLKAVFGEVAWGEGGAEGGALEVRLDDKVAHVDAGSREVRCEDEALREQVAAALRRIEAAVRPIDCGC